MAIFSGDKMGRGASVIGHGSSSRNSAYLHISLVGDKELIAKLNSLGSKVYRKVIKQASRKAFAPVIKSAREKAPKESGLLKKSIGVKQKAYPRNGRFVTIVGPRTGFAKTVVVNTPFGPKKIKRDPVKYAHLVEFGTQAHSLSQGAENRIRGNSEENRIGFAIAMQGGNDHPGATAKPFMRPAFDGNESRAKQIMRSELAAGVVREARGK